MTFTLQTEKPKVLPKSPMGVAIHRLDELLPDKWLMAQRNASGAYEET
jgi:hypothetical protein